MKDPKGHGSNKKNTGTQGMRLVKTHANGAHTAKVYNNPEWGEKVVKFFRDGAYQSKADYHTNDISDAHSTAHVALQRYADQSAKTELAKGSPKSSAVPTHDAMKSPYEDRHNEDIRLGAGDRKTKIGSGI